MCFKINLIRLSPYTLKFWSVVGASLGDKHIETLSSMTDLGKLYMHQERYDEAERTYAEVLELRRKVDADHHPLTMSSMNDLADAYEGLGRVEDAERLLLEAVELGRVYWGETHVFTTMSKSKLASLDRDQ